ncbi:MAG: hypothetical protein H6740_12490 [Alphaproteobacteria bacterium]|nr:hypothetical protein [Alphaproteobacteria bacterium]
MPRTAPCHTVGCHGLLRSGELRCARCGALRVQVGVDFGDGQVISVLSDEGLLLRAWHEGRWYGLEPTQWKLVSDPLALVVRSPSGAPPLQVELMAHPQEKNYLLLPSSPGVSALPPGGEVVLPFRFGPWVKANSGDAAPPPPLPGESEQEYAGQDLSTFTMMTPPAEAQIRLELFDQERQQSFASMDIPVRISPRIQPDELEGLVSEVALLGEERARLELDTSKLLGPLYARFGGANATWRAIGRSTGPCHRLLPASALEPADREYRVGVRVEGSDAAMGRMGGVRVRAERTPTLRALPQLKLGSAEDAPGSETVWVFRRSEGASASEQQWLSVPVRTTAAGRRVHDEALAPVLTLQQVEMETGRGWRNLEFDQPRRKMAMDIVGKRVLPRKDTWQLALNLPAGEVAQQGSLFQLRIRGRVHGLDDTPVFLTESGASGLTVATIAAPPADDWTIALDIGTSNTVAAFAFRRAADDAEGMRGSLALNAARLGALDAPRPGQVPSELWLDPSDPSKELTLEPREGTAGVSIPFIKLRFLREEEEGRVGLRMSSREVLERYIGAVIDRLRQAVPIPLSEAQWVFTFPARWEVSPRFRQRFLGVLSDLLRDQVGCTRAPVFVDEATAAAVRFARYYGASQAQRIETIQAILMVIDIGGGTTDPALIRLRKSPGSPHIELQPLGRTFPTLQFNVSGEQLTDRYQDQLHRLLTEWWGQRHGDTPLPWPLVPSKARHETRAWQVSRELARFIKERAVPDKPFEPIFTSDHIPNLPSASEDLFQATHIEELFKATASFDLLAFKRAALDATYLSRVAAMTYEVIDALMRELGPGPASEPTLLIPILTGGGSREPVVRAVVDASLEAVAALQDHDITEVLTEPLPRMPPEEIEALRQRAADPEQAIEVALQEDIRETPSREPELRARAERLIESIRDWRRAPPAVTRESVAWTEQAFSVMTRALTQRVRQRQVQLPVGGTRSAPITPFLRDLDPKIITAIGAATILQDPRTIQVEPPRWSAPIYLGFVDEDPSLPPVNGGQPVTWALREGERWTQLEFNGWLDQRLSGDLSLRVRVDGLEEQIGVVQFATLPEGWRAHLPEDRDELELRVSGAGSRDRLALRLIHAPDGAVKGMEMRIRTSQWSRQTKGEVELSHTFPVLGFTWDPLPRPLPPPREDTP